MAARAGEWVALVVAVLTLGLAVVAIVQSRADQPPRTSFTRVAGETRGETSREAAELWPVDEAAVVEAGTAPDEVWRAARCAVDRADVAPVVWTRDATDVRVVQDPPGGTPGTTSVSTPDVSTQDDGPPGDACPDADSDLAPARTAGWNVYPRGVDGVPSWVPDDGPVHRTVVIASPTAGEDAPDVAVATVVAARLAREGRPATVLVVPRYVESSRELAADLREDGAEVESGILIGGSRRVSDGAREVVRQLTTPTATLSGLGAFEKLLGPSAELVLAGLALLSTLAIARTAPSLLAGNDGAGGGGFRGFLGGLLGGGRFDGIVERRREAAARRTAPDASGDPPPPPPHRTDPPDETPDETPATSTGATPHDHRPEGTTTVHIGPHQQPPHARPEPPYEVVELRVHGVHGTSPASMLGVADGKVGRVAGDDLTGVYRIEDGDPPLRTLAIADDEVEARPRVSVEAYSWGALTSGVQGFLGWVRRSLWLLLLPFALVNLSFWARTELVRDSLEQRLGAWAVRAAGLLLTVFFVLTPCLLFLDLGAWQCFRYGVPSCDRLPDWTDRLADLTAGRRIAVASLGPMVTLAALWWLSRTTVTRYEDVGAAVPPSSAVVGAGGPGRVLRHPRLWRGRDRTRMLARRHLAAGVATVALFMAQHQLGAGRLSAWQQVAVVAVVVVGWATLLGCLVAVLGPHVDDIDAPELDATGRRRKRARAVRLDTLVVSLAFTTYAAAVALLCFPDLGGSFDQDSAWVGRSFWFIATFVAVTLLHLAVFTGGRMRLGLAIALVALIGLGLGGLAYAESVGRYGPDHTGTVVLAGAVALLVATALGAWHYRLGSGSSPRAAQVRARAWNGAGASVLLAAGAWVALLFTSATVVATADWLNGADQGVGDLVDSVSVEQPRLPAQESTKPRFEAVGDVTVDRGRVDIGEDGRLSVRRGAVSAEAVWRNAAGGDRQDLVPRVVVPSGQGRLRVPAGHVRLEDTCVRDARTSRGAGDPDRCPEGYTFRSASRVAVGAATDPPTPATLDLARGVVLQASGSSQTPLAVPPVLLWMPLAQVVWLLAVLGLLAAAYAVFRRGAGRQLTFPGQAPDTDVPLRDRPACEQARRRAALGHRAERLLDLVGLVTSVVALPLVVLALTGGAPWQDPPLAWTRALADVGMYLVVGLSALLVGLGSRMRRSESTRKAVGVLWDLTTFWPRAAHPLAPPCYAERVVPELVRRSRWVLGRDPENRLVLSGHSQGSLIVVATASRLTDAQLGRTRLVTYGSQVRALYGRVFPAVLGPDDVGYAPTPGVTRLRDPFPDGPTTPAPPADPPDGSLRGRLLAAGGSWVNLFRRTDPLGYRVFGDDDGPLGPDWGVSADLPVLEVPPDGAGDPGPRVMGHGGYQHTLAYRRVVATWTGEPVVEDVTGTAGVPTHPPG